MWWVVVVVGGWVGFGCVRDSMRCCPLIRVAFTGSTVSPSACSVQSRVKRSCPPCRLPGLPLPLQQNKTNTHLHVGHGQVLGADQRVAFAQICGLWHHAAALQQHLCAVPVDSGLVSERRSIHYQETKDIISHLVVAARFCHVAPRPCSSACACACARLCSLVLLVLLLALEHEHGHGEEEIVVVDPGDHTHPKTNGMTRIFLCLRRLRWRGR